MAPSEFERLVEQLADRLRARTYKSGEVSYTLDLRGKKWGDRGQVTVRVHGHPNWPEEGVSVTTREEAEKQIEHYAKWLAKIRPSSKGRRSSVPTWGEVIPTYLENLKARMGADHNTYKAHRGSLRNLVLPRWKNDRLTVDATQVGNWLDGLTVSKMVEGRHRQVSAAANTKRLAYAAMRACWRSHFGAHSAPSFAGVRIFDSDGNQLRQSDAVKGVIREPHTKAYRPDVVREIMVRAAVNDYLGIRSQRKLWPRAVPNTPEAIAWQIGTLTRINELMFLRWQGQSEGTGTARPMVDLELAGGMVYVPGTKSRAAPRWVVIWDAFRPWVLRMRQVSLSATDGDGHVFATPTSGDSAPSEGTYAGRIDKAIVQAGQKRPGKRTHILRATGASWLGAQLEINLLKMLMGHASAHGGATDVYLDPEVLALELPGDVRGYMDGKLPSPSSIYEEASERLRKAGHDVDLLAIEGPAYL